MLEEMSQQNASKFSIFGLWKPGMYFFISFNGKNYAFVFGKFWSISRGTFHFKSLVKA